MQALGQPAGLRRLHHEADVEIAGRLTHEMNGLLAKRFQRRPHLVQHRPDAPSHQRNYAGVGGDLHPANAFQPRPQPGHQGRRQNLRIRVQRYGHIALRGRNQIDGKPEIAEAGKHFLEKTDPPPHAQSLQRNQRDPALQHDRLDPCAVGLLGRPNKGAGQLGMKSGAHGHADAAIAQRGDRQRVQHTTAGRGDLLRFGVAEPAQQAGAADYARDRR